MIMINDSVTREIFPQIENKMFIAKGTLIPSELLTAALFSGCKFNISEYLMLIPDF